MKGGYSILQERSLKPKRAKWLVSSPPSGGARIRVQVACKFHASACNSDTISLEVK